MSRETNAFSPADLHRAVKLWGDAAPIVRKAAERLARGFTQADLLGEAVRMFYPTGVQIFEWLDVHIRNSDLLTDRSSLQDLKRAVELCRRAAPSSQTAVLLLARGLTQGNRFGEAVRERHHTSAELIEWLEFHDPERLTCKELIDDLLLFRGSGIKRKGAQLAVDKLFRQEESMWAKFVRSLTKATSHLFRPRGLKKWNGSEVM